MSVIELTWTKVSDHEFRRSDGAILEYTPETDKNAAAWWLSTDAYTSDPISSPLDVGVPESLYKETGANHNRPPSPIKEEPVVKVNEAAARLKSIIDRFERLEEEKRALAADQKDILADAKAAGFDIPVLREIFRIRRMDPSVFEERQALRETYLAHIG